MVAANLRAICRKEWGAQWWKASPVIKKARIQFAINQLDGVPGKSVHVTEADGKQYVI